MKKKLFLIVYFILFALPIPVAVLGCLLSLLWFFGALMDGHFLAETVAAFLGVVIGSTYVFSYLYAAIKTGKESGVSKKTFLPVFHCLVALVFLLALYPLNAYIDGATQRFGFAKKDFMVTMEQDTHGGFLGDGTYTLILDCSENKEKALALVEDWHPLPLPESLEHMVYGMSFTEKHIPVIENGYYMFEDRHTEAEDSADSTKIFGRGSINCSVAIYDCDTNRLYYFAMDT